MTLLHVFIAFAMAVLAPGRDHAVAADAIERAVVAAPPLFRGDEERVQTAALVVAVAFRESSFRQDAASSTGDHCLLQIHARPELADDVDACVRTGLAMLRQSLRACGTANALGVYATGSCATERGRRISRDRMALARRLVGAP